VLISHSQQGANSVCRSSKTVTSCQGISHMYADQQEIVIPLSDYVARTAVLSPRDFSPYVGAATQKNKQFNYI
jgi:hypothetical protein